MSFPIVVQQYCKQQYLFQIKKQLYICILKLLHFPAPSHQLQNIFSMTGLISNTCQQLVVSLYIYTQYYIYPYKMHICGLLLFRLFLMVSKSNLWNTMDAFTRDICQKAQPVTIQGRRCVLIFLGKLSLIYQGNLDEMQQIIYLFFLMRFYQLHHSLQAVLLLCVCHLFCSLLQFVLFLRLKLVFCILLL